jgi:uncharacterized protein YndB with AHSA1/START domain
MSTEPTVSETADREIIISRTFDAPRELVFDAFTDVKHTSAWYGPNGFTTTTERHDLRSGGEWVFTMHGPDGTDFPNWIRYREVVRPERLVYEHGGRTPDAPVHFHVTVTFADVGGGRTKLTMHSVFPTAEARNLVVERYGAIEGGHQTLARLADQMELLHIGSWDPKREIVSRRLFAAPPAVLFRAWTEPQHLARWWGPKDFRNTFHEFDLKPGGDWRFTMHGPNGADYANHSVFAEIIPLRRIVFDHVTAPEFRIIASFSERRDGTHLTFRMRFTDEQVCAAVRPVAEPSNEENFDRLAAELATMR